MTLYRMFDASRPPAEPYPGCAAVAGYIGGLTPHVWSAGEWNAASGGGRLRQLPIWQAFGAPGLPEEQAQQAAIAMRALGWAPNLPLDRRRVVVLDEEISRDAEFVERFTVTEHDYGFGVWPYGSESDIFALPPEDGYWVALFDGQPALEWPGEPVVAHQFAADVPFGGTVVDLSVVSAAGLAHLGIGLRKGT